NIYGPADPNLSRIIPGTIAHILNGEPPAIFEESQYHIREYTYISDVVEAYLLLAERIEETKGKAYNVGAGEGNILSTRELVEKIASMMGSNVRIKVIPRRFPVREIKTQYLLSERIRKLGWRPKVTIEEGLWRTIKWYASEEGKMFWRYWI
ncbi:NAD-dependent epimerase/dehydratase family protein, partial [Candidatus Poribacteria bacterium]|nr:NAD-dependent epimerase/dehydratase family protein [Candidatus Poribacteria bacterium]